MLPWHPLTAGIISIIPTGIFVTLESLSTPARILVSLRNYKLAKIITPL
jgi:hypothetical protein